MVAAFLLDWVGTLVALILAAWIRSGWSALPTPLAGQLVALGIPFDPVNWEAETTTSLLRPLVVVFVAIIWSFFFNALSVYNGERTKSPGYEMLAVFVAV